MKILVLILTCSLFASLTIAEAQCTADGITYLFNQDDIDDFVGQWNNCPALDANLIIDNQDQAEALDLTGFSFLTSLNGSLTVVSLHSVNEVGDTIPGSLSGFENLSSLDVLRIGDAQYGLGSSLTHISSLLPLNNLSGQLDEFAIGGLVLDGEFPDFENIVSIDKLLISRVLGPTITPLFPNLIEVIEFGVYGGVFGSLASNTIEVIHIPSELNSIGLEPDFVSITYPGFAVTNMSELISIQGGESLSYLYGFIASGAPLLETLSAFDAVNEIGAGGMILRFCHPEPFNSFPNLQSTGMVSLELNTESPSAQQCFQPVQTLTIGLASNVTDAVIYSSPGFDTGLQIRMNHVDTIEITGNFQKIEGLRYRAKQTHCTPGIFQVDTINGNTYLELASTDKLPKFEGLKRIEGNLWIVFENDIDGQLINLEGLEDLEYIENNLTIAGFGNIGNHLLQSLDGLQGLKHVGDLLSVRDLPNLNDVDALNMLDSIGGQLRFQNLPQLQEIGTFPLLSGVQSLSFVNTGITSTPTFSQLSFVENSFRIIDNSNLVQIQGFPSLTSLAGFIRFENNPGLNSVDLPADIAVDAMLTISDNLSLEACGESTALCNLIANAFETVISGNGSACNNAEEILSSCLALSAEELSAESLIHVYPNPSDGLVFLKGLTSGCHVRIIDLRGHVVQELVVQSDQVELQLQSLSKGMYVIAVGAGEAVYHRKLILN